MFLHLDKFRGEASVRTWGLRIARNVFLSYAKRKKPVLLEEKEWEEEQLNTHFIQPYTHLRAAARTQINS